MALRAEARWLPGDRPQGRARRAALVSQSEELEPAVPQVVKALGGLPDDTSIDGEVVALDRGSARESR